MKIITTIIAAAAITSAQAGWFTDWVVRSEDAAERAEAPPVEESDYVDFTEEAIAEMQAEQIPTEVMARIQRIAEQRWPHDYAAQEFFIDLQIEAYRRLHE